MSLFSSRQQPESTSSHLNGSNGSDGANGYGSNASNGSNGSHAINGSNGLSHGNGSNGFKGIKTFPATRTVLSSDVSIKGSVKFRTELVIDGKVEGIINSVGRLTVGKNAHIRGEIKTRSITVHGTVDGNLTVGERCELRSGCTLRGDIEAPRLVVDEDATFIGSAEIAKSDDLFPTHVGSPRGS
jgi:cytoskeletal protein CcmA (bactofilin family)